MSKKKRKLDSSFFSNKITACILIGAVILGILVFSSNFSNKKSSQVEKTNQEKATLSGLSKYLNVNAVPREYGYDNWINAEDNTLPLVGQQIVIGTNGTNGVGKYGKFTTDNLEEVNEKFLSELQGKISTYFINNGFSLNEKNTDLVPKEFYYFTTIGFEKGKIKCLSHTAKQSDPFAYISCGVENKEQLKMQKELSNVYDEQKASYQNNPITFRVDKIKNDFASGSTSYYSGNQWIAKNIQGAWSTIWSGQDFPLCSDMAKYEVPKDFYPGCYNPQTQKEQRTY